MSQTVISDFEVEDSSISSTFGTFNPYGTTISSELVQNIEELSGLEATGRLYSQVLPIRSGTLPLKISRPITMQMTGWPTSKQRTPD